MEEKRFDSLYFEFISIKNWLKITNVIDIIKWLEL